MFALLACTHQSTHRMRVNVAVHCNHMFSCSFLPRMAFHHVCSTCAVECAHRIQVQIVMTHRIWIPEMLALLACTHHSTHTMRLNVAVHCYYMSSRSFWTHTAFHQFCPTCAIECTHRMQVSIQLWHIEFGSPGCVCFAGLYTSKHT